MYVLNEHEGKKILIVGGRPGKEELNGLLASLQLTAENVRFVTPDEMKAMTGEIDIAKLSDIVLEIKAMPKIEMPFVAPIKKPHHDRNVRRHSRKSQW